MADRRRLEEGWRHEKLDSVSDREMEYWQRYAIHRGRSYIPVGG